MPYIASVGQLHMINVRQNRDNVPWFYDQVPEKPNEAHTITILIKSETE